MPQEIKGFRDEYRFLSNFWYVPIKWRGDVYPSVEHAYQASKTLDKAWRKRIREAPSPGKARELGRNPALPLRKNWDKRKPGFMLKFQRLKYAHAELKQNLLATGTRYLEETNWWHDNFFGNCVCQNRDGQHPQCLEPGLNYAGKISMQIRRELSR